MTESKRRANKRWRDKNPEAVREQAKRWHINVQRKIDFIRDDLKRLNPCVMCGEPRLPCLQFHHIDPAQKHIGVGQINRHWQGLIKEVSKCTIICANCHCMIHYGASVLPPVKPLDVSKYTPEFVNTI